ncbi:hypothetical protein NDU88_002732 [Pleurodeles waltl]|uniref:Uncharacterized protein n=1 Tax=Pleurodeles waltl TaxID=8319 RepID=A0AAV7LD95_PLEWA|nr:hypothetical protein NDU88_002732 [Pleurodeles waltl]
MGKTSLDEPGTSAGTEKHNLEEHSSANLMTILQTITASQEALELRINTMVVDLGLLQDDHRQPVEQVTTMERTISTMNPKLTSLGDRLIGMESQVKVLELMAEDAENTAKRNYIHILGLPEHNEGTNMLTYLETWLCTDVSAAGLSPFYALEQAHRVPAKPPPSGICTPPYCS